MEELIKKLFPLSKLRNDFYFWLKENEYNLEEIEINQIHKYHITKKISISQNEILTPYRYYVKYDAFLGLWYTINMAIGEFTRPNKSGIKKIEKGIVKLYYNDDFSLYDGELFYDILNEPNP